VVVAMSLSKIYRGDEANGLKEFQFRSFGETEPSSPLEGDGFVKGSPVAPAIVTSAASPAVARSDKEIEEAYAKGRRDALDDAGKDLESAARALASAAEEISRLRDSLAKNSSQDMLRLVMTIAEQIIRREVSADPQVVLAIIENALQSSVRSDQYRIRVNPEDLEHVTQQKPLFLASISGLKNLSIEADAAISRGGCRVDSDLGEVDATIETQLESIQQALNEAITDVR
jgi:flagellar assembly protein FliH